MRQLALYLGIALLVDVVALGGLAVGSGVLSVTGPPPLQNQPGGDACMSFSVSIQAAAPGVISSNWASGGLSNSISVGLSFTGLGNTKACANLLGISALDSWNDNGNSYFVATVTTSSGGPELFNATSNGGGQNHLSFSFNTSNKYSTTCGPFLPTQTANGCVGSAANQLYSFTFSFSGGVADYSILSVRYFSATHPQGSGGNFVTPFSALAQAYVRTGGATFLSVPQTAFNGGTVTATVSTGFDAGSGFQVQFNYPSLRGGGQIASQSVSDNAVAVTVSFKVPSNASQSNPNLQFNEFQLSIYAPAAQVAYQTVAIDISPQAAPGTPSLTYSDSSGNSPARVGDFISFGISARATNSSGPITSFLVWAWYLQPGQTATSLPAAGSSAWISSGSQSGQSVAASVNGANSTANYPIQITQAYNIEFQAQSASSTGQAALYAATTTVQVIPANCQFTACISNAGGHPLWRAVAPFLLDGAIVLGLAIVGVLLADMRILAVLVIAGIGVDVILHLVAYSTWFV